MSNDWIVFVASTVMVHLSQPYNRMDVMIDLYSFIFAGNLISLFFQILLNFVIVDVLIDSLLLISVVERPSLVRVAPRYLKASTYSCCCL
jgi:hypothetical protein